MAMYLLSPAVLAPAVVEQERALDAPLPASQALSVSLPVSAVERTCQVEHSPVALARVQVLSGPVSPVPFVRRFPDQLPGKNRKNRTCRLMPYPGERCKIQHQNEVSFLFSSSSNTARLCWTGGEPNR